MMQQAETKPSILQSNQEISEDELVTYWTLTTPDVEFVLNNCRGEDILFVCLAIQISSLRNTGRFIDDYKKVPLKAIVYIANQLEMKFFDSVVEELRDKTEREYRKKAIDYLGFRSFGNEALEMLNHFLLDQLKIDLFSQESLTESCKNFLIEQKILLPQPISLGRKIAKARKKALLILYSRMADKLTDKQKRKCDKLIRANKNQTFTDLQSFKSSPPEPTAQVLNNYLDRLSILSKLEIHKIELNDINPRMIKDIAALVKTYNARDLRRISPENKKYAYLLCFLTEAYKTLIDHIIELNDRFLLKKERVSRNELEKKIAPLRKNATAGSELIVDSMKKLVHCKDPDTTTVSEFKETLEIDKIEKAIDDCTELNNLETNGYHKELMARYHNLRQYTNRFYKLDFKAVKGTEPLLKSIHILRKLDEGKLSSIPPDVPTSFVPKDWKKHLRDDDGKIIQKTWEMALHLAVKKALSSGDLYIYQSRHYRDFWNTIYDKKSWEEEKRSLYVQLSLPHRFQGVLKQLKKEFNHYLEEARMSLRKEDFVYLNAQGNLKFHKDEALDIPQGVKSLKQILESYMPMTRIEKLLAEVDQRTHFSKYFQPLIGHKQKSEPSPELIYAAIIAHGTNIGLHGMAYSSEGIDLDPLRTISRWYLHEESLNNANAAIVNVHHQDPLSKIYGSGIRSGSDGQRYGVQKSSNLAAYYPRYFGYYEKAITLYTHVSDQHSVFSTQVISCSSREATYVIDGLLRNRTDISPEFHTTDTHGFTEHVFALCFLLGFSFQPLLKDLASQQLCKIEAKNYGEMNQLFSGVADIDLIEEQWDQIMRVIASIKNGIAPAHVIINRLISRVRSDRLAQAITSLGRIIKTIYILRFFSDKPLRYEVHGQTNLEESRHALAKHTFFADQGVFKTSDYEEIMNRASCLSLISNAVLLWNTIKIRETIGDLKEQGYEVNYAHLKRISPLLRRHFISHGTYNFKE